MHSTNCSMLYLHWNLYSLCIAAEIYHYPTYSGKKIPKFTQPTISVLLIVDACGIFALSDSELPQLTRATYN